MLHKGILIGSRHCSYKVRSITFKISVSCQQSAVFVREKTAVFVRRLWMAVSVTRERRAARLRTTLRHASVPVVDSPPDRQVFLLDSDSEGAAAASDKDRQRKFGQIMGLVSSTSHTPDIDRISDEQAKVLADGPSHCSYPHLLADGNDGYFTVDEADRGWLSLTRGEPVNMCTCNAHHVLVDSSFPRLHKEDIQLLIRSSEPLTDDGGKLFGMSLIRLIMTYTSVTGSLQSVSSGSEWTVSFCLQQGDDITHYCGYPDFITRKATGVGATYAISIQTSPGDYGISQG